MRHRRRALLTALIGVVMLVSLLTNLPWHNLQQATLSP
ncbi:unannotated protein [freshwater metagenome]|uniref:Unannotated protein n=1 Tax=freshwater metagenome TaxID=449393 RepID=A0A6J7I3X2_9ZZZZ